MASRKFLHYLASLGVQFSVSYPVPVMKARMVAWINDKQYWQPALDQGGDEREDAWVVNATDVLGLEDYPEGTNLYLRAEPLHPGAQATLYDRRPRSQRAAQCTGDTEPVMPRVHRVVSNFKSWLRGTHRAVSNEHLQVYLDEFVFGYNRPHSPMSAFQSLLGLESHYDPTTFPEIVAQGPGTTRRTCANRIRTRPKIDATVVVSGIPPYYDMVHRTQIRSKRRPAAVNCRTALTLSP
ncbi:hypothetical protein B5P43_35615 [Bacillus sp. SRB_336]|nr:hypothetical protein B5P43_35615 [Bacillus sp. SRB_336]